MKKILTVLFVLIMANSAQGNNFWSTSKTGRNFRLNREDAIGYVANLPRQPFGLYLAVITPRSIGIYFTFKMNIAPPKDQVYNLSRHLIEDEWGDEFRQKKEGYMSGNMGITKTVSGKVALYLAPGFVILSIYRQYYDPMEILGEKGIYYIEDDTEIRPNLNMGLVIIVGKKINLNIGGDLEPLGLNLGIGFFPVF